MIETGSERGSVRFVPAAWHDDDEIYIWCYAWDLCILSIFQIFNWYCTQSSIPPIIFFKKLSFKTKIYLLFLWIYNKILGILYQTQNYFSYLASQCTRRHTHILLLHGTSSKHFSVHDYNILLGFITVLP